MTGAQPRASIYFSWNAKKDNPLKYLIVDERPEFDLSLFDYSGYLRQETTKPLILRGGEWSAKCTIHSHESEGKGDALDAISNLEEKDHPEKYIGIFDDDITIRVSDINRALMIGAAANMTSFQPSLARCSHIAHQFTLNQINSISRRVDWIEIMMPIMKHSLLRAAKPFFKHSISSWGLDCYVLPMLAITESIGPHHEVIDASIASHTRPLQSDKKVYRNGMTARQEMKKLKEICIERLIHRADSWMQNREAMQRLFDI